MKVPLQPLGRSDIHKLESFLLVATLFRPKVLEMIRDSSDRITWVDSLAVAAAALAREKAGKSIVEIAEELGRSEATIRKHLNGETEAGKLILETYDMLAKGKLEEIEIDVSKLLGDEKTKELEERIRELEEKISRVKEKIEEIQEILG